MTVLSTAYRYLFIHLAIVFCYHCCRAMFLFWPFVASPIDRICGIVLSLHSKGISLIWHQYCGTLRWRPLQCDVTFSFLPGGDLCNHLSCKSPEIEEHFKTINWRGIKLLWYHTKFIPRQSVDIMKVNKYAQSQNLWSMAIWSKSQEIIMCIILLTSHDKSLA